MMDAAELLENYARLVARVDALSSAIVRDFGEKIQCRKGCADCCRHFSVFWVEAFNLARAVDVLPEKEAEFIRSRARSAAETDVCPLLYDGSCLLYEHRPIICRTHGLPILINRDGKASIDFCPMNFGGMETISGSAVINLDLLNETLAAVNILFVGRYFTDTPPPAERISIADALLLGS